MLVCNLGTLAPGPERPDPRDDPGRESAVQRQRFADPGKTNTTTTSSSNNSRLQPSTSTAAEGERLQAAEADRAAEGLRTGDFTPLTARSKVAGAKKDENQASTSASTNNGRHLLFTKEVNGQDEVKM